MRRIELLTTPKCCCNPRPSHSIGKNVVLEELVLHVQFMSGHREKNCNPRPSRSIGRNVVLEELVLHVQFMSGHREKKFNPRPSRSIGRNVVLEELVLSIRLYLRPVRQFRHLDHEDRLRWYLLPRSSRGRVRACRATPTWGPVAMSYRYGAQLLEVGS